MDKKLDKDELNQILDRNISWIENCDTKSSVILGGMGVVFGILLATDYVSKFIKIYDFMSTNASVWSIVYLLFCIVSILGIAIGCLSLVMVLMAKISIKEFSEKDVKQDSVIFFNTIAKNKTLKEFKKKITSCSEQNFIDDLTSQIYVCSIICSKKFVRYKIGLIISLLSFSLFIIMTIIGLFVI